MLVRRVVSAADGELLEWREVGLDRVQPTGVGRRVDRLDVVSGHECLQPSVLVGVEVVHDDVEPGVERIAGPQPGEDGEEVVDGLALAYLADEAVGVHIVEGEQLLRPRQPAVGRPEAPGLADPGPAATGQRSQFERAALVEADDRSAFRTALVEVEDAVFLTSNSGSGDCFQVLVCW